MAATPEGNRARSRAAEAPPGMPRDPLSSPELPHGEPLSAAARRRSLVFLGGAMASVGFAIALQMAAQSNFVGDEMGLSGFQQGLLETFRESCGIWALAVLGLLAGLAEPIVAAGMLALFGVGLAAYAWVPDYAWLIVASLVWSQGLHVWMPLPQSMAFALAEPGRAGHRLGQLRSAGAAGSGIGLAAALGLHLMGVRIRPLFLVAGAMALVAAGACLGVSRRVRTPGPRLVFRRRYGLFYLLSFLEGWRKQIFVAFAGYLLVKKFGTPLRTMLLLWIVIQAIGWVTAGRVGRLIDRVGERRVLVAYFGCLTLFFVGYALIPNRAVLYVLYVVDSALFVFALALSTYVNRIAPPAEHTPTLSAGVAANHVAAVTMPFVGGLLWKYAGYQWAFIAGAAAAAASILVALRLPRGPAGRSGATTA